MKLANFLWLAFAVSMLGWYGWAMAIGGAIIYAAVLLVYNSYRDRRMGGRTL